MLARKKLILFMQSKHDVIKSTKMTRLQYFTASDKKDIESWPEKECKGIWVKLERYVKNSYQSGLSGQTCPWCIKNRWEDCVNCLYGKRNIRCSSIESKYMKIVYLVGDNRLDCLLTGEYYNSLVEELNKDGRKK